MPTAVPPRRVRRPAKFAPLDHSQPAQLRPPRRRWLDLKQALSRASGSHPFAGQELLWGLPPAWNLSACRKVLSLGGKGAISAARQAQVRERIDAWIDRREIDGHAAWEGLLWLSALPALAGLLDEVSWSRLLDRCCLLSAAAADESWEDDPLRFQLLAVEMPATLSTWLVDLEGEEIQLQAQRSFLRLADEWLDGEGTPEGRYLWAMRPILASWTRCLTREHALDPGFVDDDVRQRFTWLLRQSIRISRRDGSCAFSETNDDAFDDCLKKAIELAGDVEATALFRTLWRGEPARGRSPKSPAPWVYSEWAQTASLRSSLKRESPQITVAFDERDCRLEVAAESPLLSGVWSAELTVDGQRYGVSRPWDEVCWHADDDALYLELETSLGDQWQLQRHVLIARREGFALLADAVLGEREGQLMYRTSIPLCPGVSLRPESETNEAWLTHGSRRWLALPLGLPEWRADRPLGSLSAESGRLVLTSMRQGRNLFVPLLIPLTNLRGKVDYTWRKLTVAEQLEAQPPDVAVACRMQLGDRQWAIYRSLDPPGNRTFLGKNLTNEFSVGVFHRTGEFDPIMEVE